jgi:DNA-binding transcriptional LysR family regulator
LKKKADLDIRSLRIFEAVATTGSLSLAASRVAITQSAVSQAIAQIELTLGTQLLDRTHRPMKLTAAGIALSRYARQIVEDMDRLISHVRDASLAARPAIRVGMIDSFAATVGPAIIKQVSGSASQVLLWSGLANGHAQALLNRQLDLIITSDPLEDIDGLVRRPVFTEPFLVVVPRAWERDLRKANLAKLVQDHPLIRFSARSHFGAVVERFLRRSGHTPPQYLEIDSSDVVMAMVAAELGWAITTPLCLLQGRSHISSVTTIPLPGPGFNRTIYQLSRESEYQDMTAQFFQASRSALESEVFAELSTLVPWLGNRIALC